MASPNIYQSGIGSTTGYKIGKAKPFITSGNVYYVSSTTGSNSNTGKERNKPKSTLLATLSAMSSGDTAVIMANHSEYLDASIALDGLTIVGEGSGRSMPLLLPRSGAFAVSSLESTFYNVSFGRLSATDYGLYAVFNVDCNSCAFYGCRFSSPISADLSMVTVIADYALFDSCVFTCLAPAAQDEIQFTYGLDSRVKYLTMRNCVFDGGPFGWPCTGAALIENSPSNVMITNTRLYNGSQFFLASGVTGTVANWTCDATSLVQWAA